MEDLFVFISCLSPNQKHELLTLFDKRNSLSARILCLALEGNTTRAEIERKLHTTPATFNKAGTLAKQELVEEMKKTADTPFGEVYLLKMLVLSGHFAAAQKFSVQLEKHFEEKQQWQHLELLYIEISRMCQATGDLKLTGIVSKKRILNAERLRLYVELSTILNKLLFEFEVYEKKKLSKKFAEELQHIHKKAALSGHFTLIHNALQLQYLYYSRYTHNAAQARKLAGQIYENRNKHQDRMNEITSVLALNAYLNYLSLYSGEITTSLINETHKNIEKAGKHGLFNFYYLLMEYYLFENKTKELDSLLQQTAATVDKSKFTVYRHSILALKYFSEGDHKQFKTHTDTFYENPSRLDFPEAECLLRMAEAIRFIADKREDEALYKLNSLRVFIDRNLSERYIYERETVAFLNKYVNRRVSAAQRQNFLQHLKKSPYRSIRFLERLLAEHLV
jgi:hypothetical protein